MKILILFLLSFASLNDACAPSLTTVSGSKAPKSFCSGDLIFEDNFDTFDLKKWRHENTMAKAFHWFVNDTENSYVKNGKLHLKPTLTADIYDEEFLRSGHVNINWRYCTAYFNNGCNKTGTPDKIINPVRSGGVDTWNSFAFKYGTIEVRAKLSAGDWLWPVLWMKPRKSKYGGWPRSGEIDFAEMRGNRNLSGGPSLVGNQRVGVATHFGISREVKNNWKQHFGFVRHHYPSYSEDFHKYKLVWTPEKLQFIIDDESIGTIHAGEGFYKAAGFDKTGFSNPWVNGTLMAPFDEEFYIVMELAVGGTSYFTDGFKNGNGKKPW